MGRIQESPSEISSMSELICLNEHRTIEPILVVIMLKVSCFVQLTVVVWFADDRDN